MPFLTPKAAGEREVLRTFLFHQLDQLRSTSLGLSDEQLRSVPSASDLSLLALLAHSAEVAVDYIDRIASAPEPPTSSPFGPTHSMEECAEITAELPEFLTMFDARVAWARQRFDQIGPLETLMPVPKEEWFPPELESWEARWVLTMVIAELARHAGHADIVRESIDGKGAYELNDLADAAGESGASAALATP